ncbi:MAG: response regulator, partial [Thiotrichaceae bacterium]
SVASLPKLKGSFDPLEMDEYTELQQQSRSLAESMEDLMSLTDTLELCLKSAEQTSSEQERIFKGVQEGLISTRMTKVTGLLSRLKRIVRQVSSELGKQVTVEIADENCEMDRTILERITASLEHLIRNSLAHGIEKPDERIKQGKSPQGKIVLKIDREGPEVVITLEDDGAGINVDKLRALSIKKGLINVDTVLSDKETYQLILMSGVSTADKVSQVAGRGVGMDVVNAEVNALGGNIIIDSEFGKFTRFELRVPYNLATNQLMFLDVSGELLAVPVAKLEGMQRIPLPELNAAYARKNPILECGGRSYQLSHLGETLGLVSRRMDGDEDKTIPVILFEENGQRIAYQVDEIRGNREVMLKPLGALFEQSKLLSTVAITGGGQIVLVLNAHELISLGANRKIMHHRKTPAIKTKEKKRVMVVDDSITVRKITEGLLLSQGYSVVTANDGVNALEVLADEEPDLMLLDIEMPRMDGFELLESIRSSEQWRDLPVIMISSRSGAKHRQYANKLGANGFIGKPWEANQLSNDIKACLDFSEKEVTA